MCVHISGEDSVWYVCDVLYAVVYVRVSCFVVRVCAVSRRYINYCNCDMFKGSDLIQYSTPWEYELTNKQTMICLALLMCTLTI